MQISINANRCEPSPMRKFHPFAVKAEKEGKKIYHLNIGQPDLPTPTAYYDAVRAFADKTLAYEASPGMPVLIDAIRRYYQTLDVYLDPRDILITTGGSEALLLTLLSILDPYTEVIVPEPYYPNYTTFVHAAGGVIRALPTSPDEGYRYAFRERIEKLITNNTRAIMITNPGNPTGVVLTPEEMRLMVDIAKEHNLFIIGDEAYREFVYGGEPLQSLGQFEDAAENVVVLDTVSKRFSACGARVGCIISRNKELMAHCMKMCQARLCVATLDQIASAALYEVGPEYFAAVRDEYKARRDTCMEGLKKIPGVVCECPKGAFYIMAKLPIDDADKFQIWLLEEFEDNGETVQFSPAQSMYATPGKGINEIRMAYVLEQHKLARAMELLGIALEKYNALNK